MKNGTEVTLKLSLNVIGDSNDENNFLNKLSLINAQVSKLRKCLNGSSANIKLSKTQLQKIGQSGEFLDRLLGPLIKNGFPLKKNVLKPLAKIVLIPLGLTAAASATDAVIHKKMLGSGMTKLIISETIKNDAKEQKGGFLRMLLGILGANLLGNLLISKGRIKSGEGTNRSGQDF